VPGLLAPAACQPQRPPPDLRSPLLPHPPGHCHSGMLAGAKAIVAQHIGTLEALLQEHVG
jgi:hypothetical protein